MEARTLLAASSPAPAPASDGAAEAARGETAAAGDAAVFLEAESAALSGARADDDHAGFAGGGYVDFVNAAGDSVEWDAEAPAEGSYRLAFRYANGSAADRPLELRVNGAVLRGRLPFQPTGSWRTWRTAAVDVTLPRGANAVRLAAVGSSGPNLDALAIEPAPPSRPQEPPSRPQGPGAEAEAAALSGAAVRSAHAGFTGTGYVDFAHASGDFVQWSLPVPPAAAGTRTLEFRYANGAAADRPLELRVNGSAAPAPVPFAPTGSWRTWRTATVTVSLAAGENDVRLSSVGVGGPNLDSLDLLPAGQPAQRQPVRAYHVGNSITDTIRYDALSLMAQSEGRDYVFGRHMIPGAPMDWIWEHPGQGFKENPYGHYPAALTGFEWDVLTLQPFDRHLTGPDGRGDLATARKFIDRAAGKSPGLQVYVYSRWPRRSGDALGGWSLDYQAQWLRPYTGGWDGSNETKDYFERVTLALREAYPPPLRPALLVPVGDVLFELDRRMKAGRVPGFADVNQFYYDGIHFNNAGALVVGATFVATLFEVDPRGSDYSGYDTVNHPWDRDITDAQAAAIQDAVWDVVRTHPLAGVAAA